MPHVRTLMRSVAHRAYLATLQASRHRFVEASRSPESRQLAALRRFLNANAESAYGRAHGYASCHSLKDFRARVPIVDYDLLEPWVLRAAGGEPHVLTREPIRMFERSGGSTAANKLIPYTSSLMVEFSAATEAWIADIYRTYPKLIGTTSYWSISPAARERQFTSGGHPIGIEDDAEYFGPLGRWVLGLLMSVPTSVVHLASTEEWRRATALHLLADRNLGLISVWHPSFLTLLLDFIEQSWEMLLECLPRARRVQLAPLHTRSATDWERVWPRLGMISCWTDAAAESFVPRLRDEFPSVVLQSKGLLATEGVVSIPVEGQQGAALAVGSHFMEFIDLNDSSKDPILAHELRVGGHYSPLLTTAGGFCRYHLKDVVECVGRFHSNPCVKFMGKSDATVDLRGEKLSVGLVDSALARARAVTGCSPSFALLAPCSQTSPPRYLLFLEWESAPVDPCAFAQVVEGALCESQHYAYCRSLGQLASVEVRVVAHGLRTWQEALAKRGARLGSLKLQSLDGRLDWDGVFSGGP